MRVQDCSGCVLCGGRSTRMGRDKAALPFRGGTLLSHQVDKLRKLGLAEVMVSGGACMVETARTVPDILPGHGPLSGIHACLAAARCEAVLVLSVDVPLIPASALLALVEAHSGGITLLRHGERIEPLIGVYDKALFARAGALLAAGRNAVRYLQTETTLRTVPYCGSAEGLTNCNTPEDYARLAELSRQSVREGGISR